MSELARTALAIESDLLERFDSWMTSHGYANRSQAMRDLVRSALVEAEWEDPSAEVVATLSIIYDHERRELPNKLTSLQHEAHHCILCSQHVHLDKHDCLEIIVLRGRAQQLRRIADAIITAKGVRAGKLSLMSHAI